jgi:hypothetical protein
MEDTQKEVVEILMWPNQSSAATAVRMDSRTVRKNLIATVAIAGRRSGVSAERRHLPSDFYVGFNQPAAANLCGPVRSPSPLPSPDGRGNGRQRVRLFQPHLPPTQSLVLQQDWAWFSLSQRERAGVRVVLTRQMAAHLPEPL